MQKKIQRYMNQLQQVILDLDEILEIGKRLGTDGGNTIKI
jgi:hypothetical protein